MWCHFNGNFEYIQFREVIVMVHVAMLKKETNSILQKI